MNRVRTFFRSLLADDRGLTSAEWLIIGGLIIVAAIAAFNPVKAAITAKGADVAGQIK